MGLRGTNITKDFMQLPISVIEKVLGVQIGLGCIEILIHPYFIVRKCSS